MNTDGFMNTFGKGRMKRLRNFLNRGRVLSIGEGRGQSLVEFAVMLLLLLIMLAGLVDGARALYTFMAMRDAAQEGALYGSLKPIDEAGIQARVCANSNLLTDLCGGDVTVDPGDDVVVNITYTNPTLKCMGTTSGSAHGIRVEIIYSNFPLTMPFLGTFVGSQTVPISVRTTDTILTPRCVNP